MTNEIKEILDKPKILMLSYGNYISLDDYVKLKDCITKLQTIEQQYSAILSENAELENKITNLQEENKKQEELISRLYSVISDDKENFKLLDEENKRLKETNVYCNRTDCSGRIKDSRKYDSVYQEKEDYKSRNEKALDKLYCYGEIFDSKILQQFQKEMENILGGNDNE